LYCWSDCQARAAIGRNPEGYQAPRGRDDLLFATGDRPVPEGWIVERGSGRPVNSESVRQLLLRR
ncbi:MAG: hypothetical protein K8H88_27605, partial [Sandaracinaceae bacterium]|nr:hypothetical protein [Sandaracinaceae bacterium]